MSKIFEALMRAEEDRAAEERDKQKHSEAPAALATAATLQQVDAAESVPMPDVVAPVDPVTFASPTVAADSGFAAAIESEITGREAERSVRAEAYAKAEKDGWATPETAAQPHIETFAHVVTPQPEATPVAPVIQAAASPVVKATAASPVVAAAAPEPVAAPVRETEPTFGHTLRRAEAAAGFEVWQPDMSRLPALSMRGNQVEQFRSLRSKLFEYRDLNSLKSVLVSSGLPAEGKSFVAVNLALTFARHKAARVLLIDGDLRRSSLHNVLGCPAQPGLVDYLAGKVALNQVMQRGKADGSGKPLPAGLATLTFIPAGEAGDKAPDLSNSARFSELIETLAPQFDWIIVDSSPVNLVTDGANFARACDGVLLIARGGMTKFETVQRAMGELKASRILGMVLNAVEDPPLAEGYYGYDQYEALKE